MEAGSLLWSQGVPGGALLSPTAAGRWGTAPTSCSHGRKAPRPGGGFGGPLPCQGEPDPLPGIRAGEQPALRGRALLNWAN